MERPTGILRSREPWHKAKLVGQKAPLKLKDIWTIRVRLQISSRARYLALFDLAIDSKLRACNLVKLRVRDVSHGERVAARARDRPRPGCLWHSHHQTHEGVADLSTHQEP